MGPKKVEWVVTKKSCKTYLAKQSQNVALSGSV